MMTAKSPLTHFVLICCRMEEEVMDEPLMNYVQLTQDVGCFQGHMEVLFSPEGKLRFDTL